MALKPEQTVQINFVNWLKHNYPEVSCHVIMIGNEGKRSVQGHQTAKRMGLHKFASDLFIAYPSGEFHGAFIEVKKEGWKLLPSNEEHTQGQLDFLERMLKTGYFGKVCIGLESCKSAIEEYIALKQ